MKRDPIRQAVLAERRAILRAFDARADAALREAVQNPAVRAEALSLRSAMDLGMGTLRRIYRDRDREAKRKGRR